MKLALLFLSFSAYIIITSYFQNSKIITESAVIKIPIVQPDEWGSLCDYLTRVMATNAIDKERIEVSMILLDRSSWSYYYEGLLSRLSSEKIVVTVNSIESMKTETKPDFVMLLMTPETLQYETFIRSKFGQIFTDKATKFFVIFHSNESKTSKLMALWTILRDNGLHNAYFISHKLEGSFDIWYVRVGNEHKLKFSKVAKSAMSKVFQMNDIARKNVIHLLHYDNEPLTRAKGQRIYGLEGILMGEFSSRLGINYKIVNPYDHDFSMEKMKLVINGSFDICTYTNEHVVDPSTEIVWTSEMNGICLMTPRFIYRLNYVNFTNPFDWISTALIILVMLIVLFLWKLMMIYNGDSMRYRTIIFVMYQMTLGHSIHKLERVTWKERLLVYAYIFGAFILGVYYRSMVIAFMFTQTSFRSPRSIAEFNRGSTKVLSYYNEEAAMKLNMPVIRNKLIMNRLESWQSLDLTPPDDIVESIGYIVGCSYADTLIRTVKNYRANERRFGKLPIKVSHQTYTIRKGFAYSEKFRWTVSAIHEFGVRKYLQRDLMLDVQDKIRVKKRIIEGFLEDPGDVEMPLIFLFTGCFIGFISLLIENGYKVMVQPSVTRAELYIKDQKLMVGQKKKRLNPKTFAWKINVMNSKRYRKLFMKPYVRCRKIA